LDDEDVLGVAHRKVAAKKKPGESDKAATTPPSDRDLAVTSDVKKTGSSSGSGSVKARSLIEEELHDPEMEKIQRKVAQRAAYNPLQPPGYVPPSQGANWGLWLGLGGALLFVVLLVVVLMRTL
jgi:hypothetical protein